MLAPNIGGFSQPAGATLLTMKQTEYASADKYPNKLCGAFGEFCHPVRDINQSIAFWKKLGFTSKNIEQQPYPHAIISDGLMIIGLHQTKDFDSFLGPWCSETIARFQPQVCTVWWWGRYWRGWNF